MTFFSAYHVIHACCDQKKPLKWSLNYICENEYFKNVIESNVYMKLSLKAREKIILSQINFGTHFLSLKCVKTSMGVPFCCRLSLERFRRVRYLTIYDFHQLHFESVENVMLSTFKRFDRHFSLELCLLSVSIWYWRWFFVVLAI